MMSSVATPTGAKKSGLLRVLGLGFGLAVVVGGTIGVSIFRLPGPVAALLPTPAAALAIWALGGLYTLLSANYTAELATLFPNAGGPYVYAMRAFGNFTGFLIAWTSWLGEAAAIAFISIAFGEYAGTLFPSLAQHPLPIAMCMLAALFCFNLAGVHMGSRLQQVTSALKALALIGFVVVCFWLADSGSHNNAAIRPVPASFSLPAFVLAFQLVLGAFGGWNTAIYFAEEDTNPSKNLPRALQGGTLLVTAVYLLVNAAIFYVLPVGLLAESRLAAADALQRVWPGNAAAVITILALVSIVGIINATIMFVPRALFAMSRDGFFMPAATRVNRGGTPAIAMLCTVGFAMVLMLLGSFERLMAVYAFYAVGTNLVLLIALFRLRRKYPNLPRPVRTWGYPVVPFLLLLVSTGLLASVIIEDAANSAIAMGSVLLCYPLYLLRRKMQNEPEPNE